MSLPALLSLCSVHVVLPHRPPGVASRVAPALGRREVLKLAAAGSAATVAAPASFAKEIELTTSSSGLKWTDLRQGVGPVPSEGQRITIDYMMSKRAGAKIHSTKDAQQPFTWTLGDGTVIEGLELAILGGGGIPPMQPGGIRRVMVPQYLGYGNKKGFFQDGTPTQVNDKLPVPPKGFEWVDAYGDRVNSYLRFKDIYQNEMRLDEPDLILDIILQSGRVAPPAS